MKKTALIFMIASLVDVTCAALAAPAATPAPKKYIGCSIMVTKAVLSDSRNLDFSDSFANNVVIELSTPDSSMRKGEAVTDFDGGYQVVIEAFTQEEFNHKTAAPNVSAYVTLQKKTTGDETVALSLGNSISAVEVARKNSPSGHAHIHLGNTELANAKTQAAKQLQNVTKDEVLSQGLRRGLIPSGLISDVVVNCSGPYDGISRD